MIYNDMPVIIPLLATGYLLTIYLLLTLAQRTLKSSGYVAHSMTDSYAPYEPTESSVSTDEVKRWSRSELSELRFPMSLGSELNVTNSTKSDDLGHNAGSTSVTAPRGLSLKLTLTGSQIQQAQEATTAP
ncbi:MAG TPA: hypothetical protein V6D33_09490 [Cyanophyceae cyanobacterium]